MKRIYEILGLGIIDRYIMRKFISTFFFCVLLFSLIAIFVDISEKMDDFIKLMDSSGVEYKKGTEDE